MAIALADQRGKNLILMPGYFGDCEIGERDGIAGVARAKRPEELLLVGFRLPTRGGLFQMKEIFLAVGESEEMILVCCSMTM